MWLITCDKLWLIDNLQFQATHAWLDARRLQKNWVELFAARESSRRTICMYKGEEEEVFDSFNYRRIFHARLRWLLPCSFASDRWICWRCVVRVGFGVVVFADGAAVAVCTNNAQLWTNFSLGLRGSSNGSFFHSRYRLSVGACLLGFSYE